MSIQKTLPVITSIAIILLVAVLRERSRTLAAIVSTMPINIPLALWVVFGAGDYDAEAAATFVRFILIGLFPLLIWVAIVYLALRNDVALLPAIGIGYLVWGVITGIMLWAGILSVKR